MAQTSQEELMEYIGRVGEHINRIYEKLKSLEAQVEELSNEINEVKSKTSVDRDEFQDFIKTLRDSLKELVPPLPQSEAVEESNLLTS